MRVLLGLIILCLAAAGVIYGGVSLFFRHSSGLLDSAAPTKLSDIMPQLLAAVATVTAALVGGGVALINWLAQRDLASVQRKYLHDLEVKKSALSGQLEDKKSALSIELEREKAQIDVLKSEVSRNLALFQRAIDVIGRYASTVRTLRRGLFDPDRVEECETEMRSLLIEFDRTTDPFDSIQKFLTFGIYVKERAERKSTPQGFKDLWAEKLRGERVSTTFARFEDNALVAIRRTREACLADNALSTS
ncbi:hypothetical protein E9232_006851 [Inquilinus ginsengisoli]|uniref:DUF3450 domain-containing protein n=1 Tax=Inquilinus ginsengisoli TaxID=363840 RepID=A0ABU1K1B1_9PROT|nr:hypothetical protein [Inquilinus ginsengisoli]MDR6294297.1 hypothetical protein [Inquilinus ginsengisoli]